LKLDLVLHERRYKTPAFAELLLDLVRDHLRLPTWTSAHLLPSDIHIFKVSGSLTNAVFFISSSTFSPSPRTLLLRIYGPSSSSLISRPSELRTLHALSSIYHMGPRIYGTFGNGRVEEYFESEALTAESMRDKKISRWIGRRMGELHHVDLSTVVAAEEWGDEDVAIKRNLGEWIAPAGAVLNTLASKLEYVFHASLSSLPLPLTHQHRKILSPISPPINRNILHKPPPIHSRMECLSYLALISTALVQTSLCAQRRSIRKHSSLKVAHSTISSSSSGPIHTPVFNAQLSPNHKRFFRLRISISQHRTKRNSNAHPSSETLTLPPRNNSPRL
jgi:hypothetical protein